VARQHTGAGFSLSPEEAKAVLAQADAALLRLRLLLRQTEIWGQVTPAAGDPASIAYNSRLSNGHGVFDAAREHVNAEFNHLGALIDKIKAGLRVFTGHETEAARDIGKAGTPKGGVAG
jgi:hypothetical protein